MMHSTGSIEMRQPQRLQQDIQQDNKSLEEIMAKLQEFGHSVNLYNSDGTINRTALQQVIESDEFSQWRKENPRLLEGVKNVEQSIKSEGSGRLMQDALRIGVGLNQQRQARQIDETPPAFPDAPRRSQFLAQELGRTQALASTGLSPEDRARMATDADRVYRSQLGQIATASSGQGGASLASQQAAARQRYNQDAQIQGIANQQAQRERANLGSLMRQEFQQEDMIRRHGVNQFMNRDYPIFRARQRAAEALMNAGVTNALSGFDAGIGDLVEISNTYRGDAPGMVMTNSSFEGIGDPPAASTPIAMFANASRGIYDSPAFRMSTGANIDPNQPNNLVPDNRLSANGTYGYGPIELGQGDAATNWRGRGFLPDRISMNPGNNVPTYEDWMIQ